jgi:hypothetical protein
VNPRPRTFTFSPRARISYALVGFLFLSLFIHLVTFYLLRVEYPPSVTITPPPARAVMLRPDTKENKAFLRWIDASDPAIFAQAPMAEPPAEKLSAFEPSYATRNSELIVSGLFDTRHPVTFPPAIDGVTLAMRMKSQNQSTTPITFSIPPTKIFFYPSIQKRLAGTLPDTEFHRTNATSLTPATFLVGTPSSGDKPLIFLQTSSGDETLDQEAEHFLRGLPFSNGEQEWGFVTFFWGPEIFAVPQSSESAS